jgi:nucleoside-diphosphate-sugar epimerase
MRFDLLVNDMARAVVLGETIKIFAPDAWRPFLHIRDAAGVIEWALGAAAGLIGGRVFNVVGDNYRKRDLADLVRRHFPAASIEFTDAIPDLRDYRASGERIRREGGFAPRHSVEDALLEIAAAVKAGAFRHPRWDGYAAAPMVAR